MNSKILIYTRKWFESYYSKLEAQIERDSTYEVVRFSDYSVKGAIDFRKRAVESRDEKSSQKRVPKDHKCFNDIIWRDRLLRTLEKTEAIERVRAYYQCFSDYLEKNDVKLVVSATVDQYFIDVVYLLCLEHKIKFIGYHVSLLPNYLLITGRGESNLVREPSFSEINESIEILNCEDFKPSYIPESIKYKKNIFK